MAWADQAHPVTVLDGGLATSLQRVGLPAYTPVDEWLLERIELVRAAHAAFVEVGAERLLTGSFRALPGVSDRWSAVLQASLGAARGLGVPVDVSLGPVASGVSVEWSAVMKALTSFGGADGVVLETFVRGRDLVDAVRACRSGWGGRLVACLTPGPGGLLWDGDDPAPWLAAARAAGATSVGFNCGPGVVAAALRCPVDRVKPNCADAEHDALIAALPTLIAGGLREVGGCCGTGPPELARIIRGLA